MVISDVNHLFFKYFTKLIIDLINYKQGGQINNGK